MSVIKIKPETKKLLDDIRGNHEYWNYDQPIKHLHDKVTKLGEEITMLTRKVTSNSEQQMVHTH